MADTTTDKYALPDYVTSRLRYYNGQFLREADFIDESKYLIVNQRRHERLLHVAGIVEGLAVTVAQGGGVTVSAGSAIDGRGRPIVLTAAQTLAVTGTGTLYVETSFSEAPSNPADSNSSVVDNTRFSQATVPVAVVGTPTAGNVVLAQLAVTAAGTPPVVTTDVRVYSGVALPTAGAPIPLRSKGDSAPGWAELGGSLSVKGTLTTTGNVGINNKTPTAGRLQFANETCNKIVFWSTSPTDQYGFGLNASTLTGFFPVGATFTLRKSDYGGEVFLTCDTTGNLSLRKSMLMLGTTDGSNAAAGEVVGGIGFLGYAQSHGQISYRTTKGFELVDRSGDGPSVGYAEGKYVYTNLKLANLAATGAVNAQSLAASGAVIPSVGNSANNGIQFPNDPGGGGGDQAFMRYFVQSAETCKLLIGIENDADDTIGLWQMGAERVTVYNGNLGVGTPTPQDKLEVKGMLRVLTDGNPLRITSNYQSFPDQAGVLNQAEISNDTSTNKTLMIVGNKSSDGKTRRVSVWDRFEVNTPGTGAWAPFIVTNTTQWGDVGASYVTIGAGGAAGIMFSNPHVTWFDNRSSIRYGRAGGVPAGTWWDVGTRGDGSFTAARENGAWALRIDPSNNVGFSAAIVPSVGNSANNGIQFPNDPGGGGGDQAFMRYFVQSAETCKLLIGIENDADDTIGLWQMGAERMTVYNGNVGVGTTTPQDKLEVKGPLRILTDSNPVRFTSAWSGFPDTTLNQAEICNDTGGYKTLMIVGNRSNDKATRRVSVWDRLEVNGPVVPTLLHLNDPTNAALSFEIRYESGNDTVVFYHQSGSGQYMRQDGVWHQNSDAVLKENVVALDGMLDRVMQLRPVRFDWKNTSEHGIGFVAQEVEPVLPDLVSARVVEDGTTIRGLPYSSFGVVAIAAIREMKEAYDRRIEALEQQIAALKKPA